MKLKSDASSGQWVVADDWLLVDGGDSSISPRVQAFSTLQKNSITGLTAEIWTAEPPVIGGAYNFVASPVGICHSPGPCTGLSETGYYKGYWTSWELRQFFSFRAVGYPPETRYLDALSQNAAYTFSVKFNSSTSRWEIYRNNQLKDYQILNFGSGQQAVCGVEADDRSVTPPSPDIAVECSNLSYQINNGSWQSYDFNATKTARNYCVSRPYQYGALAYGPC